MRILLQASTAHCISTRLCRLCLYPTTSGCLAGSRLLDVASNAGSPALQLANALPQIKVTSTDKAPKSVDLAVKRIAAQKLTNATAEAADGQDLKNFDNSSFAAVTCAYGLMHMPDSQLALREAFRVLESGGIYLATIWKKDFTQMGQV